MNMTFRPNIPAPSIQPYPIVKTFVEAAESYMQHGGDKKYLPKIVPIIGSTPLNQIFPFDIRELAKELFPAHSNGTRNRCVITPVRAVCYHAYDRGVGSRCPDQELQGGQAETEESRIAGLAACIRSAVRGGWVAACCGAGHVYEPDRRPSVGGHRA